MNSQVGLQMKVLLEFRKTGIYNSNETEFENKNVGCTKLMDNPYLIHRMLLNA